MSKNVRGCVLNFWWVYEITNLLGFFAIIKPKRKNLDFFFLHIGFHSRLFFLTTQTLHGHPRNGFWKDFENSLFSSYIGLITLWAVAIPSYALNLPIHSHQLHLPFICLLIMLLLITSWSSYSEDFTDTIIKIAIAFIRIMLAKPNRNRLTLSACSSDVNSNLLLMSSDCFLLWSAPWKGFVVFSQLPGRLFSPSDIFKKLSHHFLLHFSIGLGSYYHHAKYQGVFP